MAAAARIEEVVAEYFSQSQSAEQARQQEQAAAVAIQSQARAFLVRLRLERLRRVAVTIQRWWRGYLGKARAKLALQMHSEMLRKAYFDARATTIQRHFRGYRSRKFVFSYSARKAFLQQVRKTNELSSLQLAQEEQQSKAALKEAAWEEARGLFQDRIASLHHLVSTASQPGIFNSPYALATGAVPALAGAPIEEHLRATFKAKVAERLPPIKPVQSPTRARRDAPDGSAGSLTLRQSMPYGAAHELELRERKVAVAEMLQMHPRPFSTALQEPFYPEINPQQH